MKRKYQPVRALALAATLATGIAGAATDSDSIVFSAGGACQSNNSAINDVRFRVGGVVNVGAPSIYVICSAPTEYQTGMANDAVTGFEIKISNTSGTVKNIQCTLQPGYTNIVDGSTAHQGSFPKQANVAGQSATWIGWSREDIVGVVSTDEISSPNVICLLPQGTMVHYLVYSVTDEIGA